MRPRSHFDPLVGTEELGHLEMIGAIVHQLTRNMKDEQYKDPAFAPYFVDHTTGVYPASAGGTPWSAMTMQVKGDPMTDLVEDMAAEAAMCYLQHRLTSELRRTKNPLRCNGFSVFKVGDPISALVDPIPGRTPPISI